MIFTQPTLAIDIGASSVKIAKMERHKIAFLDYEVLPSECVVDGILQNQDELFVVLENLLQRNGLTKSKRLFMRVGLSLGGAAVLMKKIDMAVAEEEIDANVYYEAEQQLQLPLEEMYVSYHRLERSDSDFAYPIIVAGARREVVDAYVELIHSLGLKVGVIDCDSFCISNMFEVNYGVTAGASLLINIGASSAQVSFLEHGVWLNSSEIPMGGHFYSRTIAGRLGIEIDAAESLKISTASGSGGTTEALSIIQEVNQQLLEELQRTIDFFGIQHLQTIYLSGGTSRILGLANTMSSGLGVPTNMVNPFLNIELPRKYEKSLQEGHIYSTAVGLALRNFERKF